MEFLDSIIWLWNQVYHWDIWKNQLFLNTLGGIFAAMAVFVLQKIYRYWRSRRIKYLLGMDADKEGLINLVYAKLQLPDLVNQKNEKVSHPYIKPNYRGNPRQFNFSIEFPVSSCEVRALKYLTSSLINQILVKTKLVADVDENINSKLNMSFISLGGPGSNYKTEDLMLNKANKFLTMDTNNFFSKNGKKLLNGIEPGYDYGVILRLRPKEFEKRVWVICAGIGEWGTSGSAWFLSNKYNELLKRIKSSWNILYWSRGKDFAAIIKVKQGQDESADIFAVFKTEDEINNFTAPEIFIESNKVKNNPLTGALSPGTGSMNPVVPTHSASAAESYIVPSGIQTDLESKE